MESEPSWWLLAVALVIVLGLTALVMWLSATEVDAVTPAPATGPGGRPEGAVEPSAARHGPDDGDDARESV